MKARIESPPLIAHVVHRFDVGGLENGVVNLINRMPVEAYRHAVIALTEVTDFRGRIIREDVRFFALHKGPGHGVQLFPRLFRLFRTLSPSIVHTRNLAALEAAVPAWAAAVPARVHGEHGRDIGDLLGSNRKYQWVRRLHEPFVNRYVAVSKDLERYLCHTIGVSAGDVFQIYNGVDTARFAPALDGRSQIEGCPFSGSDLWLVGTVGRLQAVKDQITLAKAFVRVVQRVGHLRIGEVRTGLRHLAWLPGERSDVPDILRGLDCFVLPSLAEGISNTVLEAMASGVPVIATRVGGNIELVQDGITGRLVPVAQSDPMAEAVADYFGDVEIAKRHGRGGRDLVLRHFSLDKMVKNYLSLYDQLLSKRKPSPARVRPVG